ncbi:hypothetical protein [Collimonas sp. PA-H2]|uniref:hypothetical protein n=1 Tax=Collimonas sp. PA-H2 TaxID=1881062 RepID=UPI00117CF09A|nr:hypothetical protein [Collimonas sp. PA-H2]
MCSIQKSPTINNLLTYSSPNEAMPLLFQGLKNRLHEISGKSAVSSGFWQQIETKFTRTGFAAMPHWSYAESVVQARTGSSEELPAPLTKRGIS